MENNNELDDNCLAHIPEDVMIKCHEELINDRVLQRLHVQRVEIYSKAVPMVFLKDDKLMTVWLDETNHPLLPKIEEAIKARTEQIKQFYLKQ